MALPVKTNIELENGKKLDRCQSLVIRQLLFNHHEFEIRVPFDALEDADEIFFHRSHKDVCGKRITVSFEPVFKKESFSFQFKGIVTQILLSNLSDLSNAFILKGYSPTVLFEDHSVRRSFLNKNLQQIFESVLNAYPSNVVRKKLSPRHSDLIKYCVQYDETNFEFLNRIAAEYGEWFFYNGKEVLLGMPAEGKELDFIIDGVQSFDMSISLLPAKFKMNGYDYTRDGFYKGQSSSQQVEGLSPFGKFALDASESLFGQDALYIAGRPVYSQNEMDEMVKLRRSATTTSMIQFHGRGEIPDISIGSVIDAGGTRPQKGGRSSKESCGKYRVTEITHTVDDSGNYSNSFKAVPAVAKFPPVNDHVRRPVGEPELAKVIDNNDPDKMGRVKLEFNWPGDDRESDWVRVGSFYSGGDDRKGMQFIPEKGAQVMVGYELNRPESPFVITSLYPKKDGMRSRKGNNDEKMFYTKAGNSILLIDKQGENKIEITNSNKDDTAIVLEFKDNGVINIKTNGKVQIEAQENVSIQAGQKLSLEAQEIEIKANVSAKMSSANTEVSGDAMTTIKGGLVKIN